MSKRVHVVPHGGGWAVRLANAASVESRHRTQAEAEVAARRIAVRLGGEVAIHRPDGRIRDANSYGHDSFPPKG